MYTERFSIILPTYNEVLNINPLIDQIVDELKDYNYEILVVDDDSPDGTSEVVKEKLKTIPHLRLITRKINHGLIASIKEGIHQSQSELCIWMDADLSMSPNLIPLFLKKISDGSDLVLGSRYIKGGGMKGVDIKSQNTSSFRIFSNLISSEDSLLSALISQVGNYVLRKMLNPNIHDYSSGFFAAKKSIFKKVAIDGNFVDYCISLPYLTNHQGFKVTEVPMVLNTRKFGKSKTSNSLYSILSISIRCFWVATKLKLATLKK